MTLRAVRSRRLAGRACKPMVELLEDRTLLSTTFWSGFGGNAQHTAQSSVASQPLEAIRWQSAVDLSPVYSGSDLLIHYGEPLITQNNTVIIPVKTGATDGFRIEAHDGYTGALRWTESTDYTLTGMSYNWTPSYSPVLTPQGRVYFAGDGGTIYYFDNADSPIAPTVHQLAFYGLANYQANAAGYNSTVFIDTPLTSDANGNIFFGFRVQGTTPEPLSASQSGWARIDAATGNGAYVLVGTAAADAAITRDCHNTAPAVSNDGTTIYVVAKWTSDAYYGYLLGLDATTLATKYKVFLNDPRNANNAGILDDGTASPVVGPDGDVYLGVMANPGNGSRGFTLHFNSTLTVQKAPSAFGWDDSDSIVPASMVPSYTGTSSYLLFSKYNNYAGIGGDGYNQIAILDPNATQTDTRNDGSPAIQVMREVLTVAGPTPDPAFIGSFPNARREWCINSCVVDPFTKSVFANSEDGKLYRWDLTTNTLSQTVTLTPGVGEAYTPTAMGPDGTVYAINNATLFAVGRNSWQGYGGNPQHSALSTVAAQPLNAIHWSVNIDPGPSGNAIHYASPMITPNSTVIVPIRTGSNPSQTPTTDTFAIQAVNGATGAALWNESTDYVLPSYGWTPSFPAGLTPEGTASAAGRVYLAGAGGTLLYTDNPDSASPTFNRLAFYNIANYNANPTAYNSTVFIDTPITADSSGNIFFGFQVTGSNPSGLASGIARIDKIGNGSWTSASTALGGDPTANLLVQHNSAPVLSNDGATLFVGITASDNAYYSWLAALDSTTLALKQTSALQPEKVRLMDPRNNNANPARIIENSSAAPMIAPDGSVVFGVFANPYNGSRGIMLHFSSDLQIEYTAGAFGWDDTASIVPASMVPGYNGTSSYLIFTKYNNYVAAEVFNGGDGVNEIAVLDPFATQLDNRNDNAPTLQVMKEVSVISGPVPDAPFLSQGYQNAVREWCINTAAVDPFTKSIMANSEDGVLYRWDLTTGTLLQSIRLTGGVGEAYTPTVIGPDGTVYAINDHVLFAVGGLPGGLSVSEASSVTPSSLFGQSVTFTAAVTSTGTAPTGSVNFYLDESGTPAATVVLDGAGHASFTTAALAAGSHFVKATYSGDMNYGAGSVQLVQSVLQTSATAVASSLNSSVYGQSVTFTATVSRGGPTAKVPVGSVTFLDGATVLGTVFLNGDFGSNFGASAQATFTTNALAVGTHSITVSFPGDTNFTPSSSSVLSQVVQSATSTGIVSSANPSVYGQSVVFTATVSATSPGGGTPTGMVTFYRDGSAIGSAALTGGQANFTTAYTLTGSHNFSASFAGSAGFQASASGNLSQTVNAAPTTTGVTLAAGSSNPSVYGQPLTFVVGVTANSPSVATPSGSVTFYRDGVSLGTKSLSGGQASFATTYTLPGSHNFSASYAGNASFLTSPSTTFSQTVNAAPTTTVVARAPGSTNPSVYGQPLTFVVTVTANSPSLATPGGSVTFFRDGVSLGTKSLSGGQASFFTTYTAVGSHTFTASFAGNSSFLASNSSAVAQTVNAAATTTGLAWASGSGSPSVYGQPVTFIATIAANAPSTATPTGTVTFYRDGVAIGAKTLSGGQASLTTAFTTVGSHTFSVTFAGNSSFLASSSGTLSQIVNKAATTTSLTAAAGSPNPSTLGQSVTFVATVTANSPSTATVTGSVSFYADGTTLLGTIALSAGTATLSTSSLSVGSHQITAVYLGNSGFLGNTSNSYVQVVNASGAPALNTSLASPAVPTNGQADVVRSMTSALDDFFASLDRAAARTRPIRGLVKM